MATIAAGATTPVTAFSIRLREATLAEHRATERSPFIVNLLKGLLPVDAYAAMTGQWSFLYGALEREMAIHRDHPTLGPFDSDVLLRGPALSEDLTTLLGSGWEARIDPLPATSAYIERLQVLGTEWPTGLLAHHYLRYLGDLSGGQIIARVVRRTYGFVDDAATRFYQFDGIADLAAYKAGYRDRLDRLPVDAAERERLIAEVDDGYRMTARIFGELDGSFGPTD